MKGGRGKDHRDSSSMNFFLLRCEKKGLMDKKGVRKVRRKSQPESQGEEINSLILWSIWIAGFGFVDSTYWFRRSNSPVKQFSFSRIQRQKQRMKKIALLEFRSGVTTSSVVWFRTDREGICRNYFIYSWGEEKRTSCLPRRWSGVVFQSMTQMKQTMTWNKNWWIMFFQEHPTSWSESDLRRFSSTPIPLFRTSKVTLLFQLEQNSYKSV